MTIYLFITTALLPASFSTRAILALIAMGAHAFSVFAFPALENVDQYIEQPLTCIKVTNQ